MIGDIRDYERMEEVIREYGVNSIYHAAAYKHVPMMEHNVIEAVTNNVIGLDNMVNAAYRNGVSSFLMISSDKAVNPDEHDGTYQTRDGADRVVDAELRWREWDSICFGALWQCAGQQWQRGAHLQGTDCPGGPVTVTHPDMRRYFMTIPEAVQLVLQASVMGKGSEIFVLDMGEPVRIRGAGAQYDSACPGMSRTLISRSEFVGLRPGEKLFEELCTESEETQPTYHEKIMVFCGSVPSPNAFIEQWIAELRALVSERNDVRVLSHLAEIVPEYQPSGNWQVALQRRALKAAAGD